MSYTCANYLRIFAVIAEVIESIESIERHLSLMLNTCGSLVPPLS